MRKAPRKLRATRAQPRSDTAYDATRAKEYLNPLRRPGCSRPPNRCSGGARFIPHRSRSAQVKVLAALLRPVLCFSCTMAGKEHSVAEGVAVGGHAGKAIILGPWRSLARGHIPSLRVVSCERERPSVPVRKRHFR